MKNYHAHVYFDSQQANKAKRILSEARQQSGLMKVFWLIPRKVGPHVKPMFEIHFQEKDKEQVIEWLEKHRENLSVLIHQDTGDDIKDHTENVLWLGDELELDFSFFEMVKRDPGQVLHKKN